MSLVSVDDLRAAKRLSTAMWDGLLPSERQRALSLLGTMYRYFDELATYTGFANGRIEQLREALTMLIREAQNVADDCHRPRYTRLDQALESARRVIAETTQGSGDGDGE